MNKRVDELAARFRTGETDVVDKLFAELIANRRSSIATKAREMGIDADEHESNIGMSLVSALETWEPERGSFLAYVNTLALRKSIDDQRRMRIRQQRTERYPNDEAKQYALETAATVDSAEATAIAKTENAHRLQAMDTLINVCEKAGTEIGQRLAATLRMSLALDTTNFAEIARNIGVSRDMTKRDFARLRKIAMREGLFKYAKNAV